MLQDSHVIKIFQDCCRSPVPLAPQDRDSRYDRSHFSFALPMSRRNQTRKAKPRPARPRSGRLILACVVIFVVLLLLLRMLVFVHGHGRR